MRKLLEKLKRLSVTEWLLIGTALLLVFQIFFSWERISKDVIESLTKIFKR